MQTCGTALLNVLQSAQRDLPDVDLFEFYAPSVTSLQPTNATKRYASSEIIWYGWKYDRQAISRGDISRFIDGRFNSVNITFSNVDRSLASWLAATDIEGYRVVIRMISRSVSDDSIVLFVGRCEKPFDVDNTTVTISVRQDLGSIDNDLPWNLFSSQCPLKFKGTECLAGQALGSKSATYQAATTCNKSFAQCVQYDNRKAFQGFRFNGVSGNFKYREKRIGLGALLGSRRQWKQWSSQDDAPYGKAIPMGLGRASVDLAPIVSADTGEYLYGHWVIGEGEVTKILNLRNVTSGWADTFQFLGTHTGDYGYDADQESDSDFLGYEYYSHKAYVEATIKGQNPDTGDPAPTLAAVILWPKIPVFDETCFTGLDWSDNPVEHLRYLLTEVRGLGYADAWIDNTVASDSAAYCNQPMLDTSGSEDAYFSADSGTAGTDYKRYRSTGLLDTYYWRWKLGLDTTYPAEREITYQTYESDAPPANPTPSTYYRKRYTSNWYLREAIRTTDFIFKHLLPSFRGYLVTGADGRLQIRAERPAIVSYLRGNTSIGATSVAIEDALAWKQLNLPVYYALIGVNQATSETRQVTAISYSTAGNSITLAVSSGMTRSGSTLSGGTTSIQANGYVTVTSATGTKTVTIDGVAVSYTPNAQDTIGTIGAILATRINADTTLNRYVQAIWASGLPEQVVIRSKLGTLTLASGLTSAHTTAEQVVQIHAPFADASFGALSRGNVLRDTFRWPLGGKQSSYNQFVIAYNDAVLDFQTIEIRENDYDHQEQINKVNKLEISGACVDNYHQASRLVQAARYKYRDGDFFCSMASTGLALLLEEGDIICVNHSNMSGYRNLLLRVEELRIDQQHRVSIVGRLYADNQFPESATQRTILLTSGIGWVSNPPGSVTGLTLSTPSSGIVRGTFTFATYIGAQTATVEVRRAGDASYIDTGLTISPDSTGGGAFEVSGIPTTGTSYFRVTPIAGNGQTGTASTIAWNPDAATTLLAAQIFGLSGVLAQAEGYDPLEVAVFSRR
jgi:hypothetical protein